MYTIMDIRENNMIYFRVDSSTVYPRLAHYHPHHCVLLLQTRPPVSRLCYNIINIVHDNVDHMTGISTKKYIRH
jgi:hypothetical protein